MHDSSRNVDQAQVTSCSRSHWPGSRHSASPEWCDPCSCARDVVPPAGSDRREIQAPDPDALALPRTGTRLECHPCLCQLRRLRSPLHGSARASQEPEHEGWSRTSREKLKHKDPRRTWRFSSEDEAASFCWTSQLIQVTGCDVFSHVEAPLVPSTGVRIRHIAVGIPPCYFAIG